MLFPGKREIFPLPARNRRNRLRCADDRLKFDMQKENKRVVLVTGASSGIGQACAKHLAALGFRVYGTSRRAPAAADGTGNFVMLAADVTSDDSVAQAVAQVLAREGRIDIVVNNAGMGFAGPLEATSIDQAKWQFEVNFFGAMRVCRAVLPVMRQQRSGYIVNIGSIGGLFALPYQSMYSASKFALEGMSEAMRMEVRPFGIHVVLVEPGDHKTAITQNRRVCELTTATEAYRASFEPALAKTMHDEQNGPGPEQIARLVHRIVNQRNPRMRYAVGPLAQKGAILLKRLAPYSLLEFALRKYFALGA